MKSLPTRLDDGMLARLEAYAAAPLPALPRTDETHLLQFLRVLAIMPRAKSDHVTAELRVGALMRMLGHLPRAALDWMTDEALRRFQFHPSIKELIDLSTEWERDDDSVRAQQKAANLARRERQARMDDALRALHNGEVDDEAVKEWPDHWRSVAEARGLLLVADGECRVRPSASWRPSEDISPDAALAAIGKQFPTSRAAA
jgi:hypothetical protein